MRHDVKEPTTMEEWAASRCQEADRAAFGRAISCEDKASRKCDACGKRTCPLHWRHHGWRDGAPELCVSCWEARADERAEELARSMRVLTPEECAAEEAAKAGQERWAGLLDRLRRLWGAVRRDDE
jgi:hypothetical protein